MILKVSFHARSAFRVAAEAQHFMTATPSFPATTDGEVPEKRAAEKKGAMGGRLGQSGGVSGKSISALTRMHFYGTL